jgi:hypothetical protein
MPIMQGVSEMKFHKNKTSSKTEVVELVVINIDRMIADFMKV